MGFWSQRDRSLVSLGSQAIATCRLNVNGKELHICNVLHHSNFSVAELAKHRVPALLHDSKSTAVAAVFDHPRRLRPLPGTEFEEGA